MTDAEVRTDLEQAIARTLCWFSVFEYPMTTFEIHKWLLIPKRPSSLSDVSRVLETSEWLKHLVWQKDGFAQLKEIDGKQVDPVAWIQKRHEGYIDATKKMRALKRVGMYFRFFGSVRMVAAVNSIAWAQTTPKSDIDLFIVTKSNTIWFTRFWLVLPFVLFRARPNQQKISTNKYAFCFSFFVSEHALSMKSLQLNDRDYYFPLWMKSMIPIVNRNHTQEKLFAQNSWIQVYAPNAKMRIVHPLHEPKRVFPFWKTLSLFEPMYRSIQQRRFPGSIQALANKDSRVVVTDAMLKFHEDDRRATFRETFLKRFESLV